MYMTHLWKIVTCVTAHQLGIENRNTQCRFKGKIKEICRNKFTIFEYRDTITEG